MKKAALAHESPADFNALYKSHYQIVAAAVAKFRFAKERADDVIQETFIQAWQSLASLKDPKAFRSWLIVIARNNCLRSLKQMRPTEALVAEESSLVLIADDQMASLHFEHSLGLLKELIAAHGKEPRGTIARRFYLEHQSIREICLGLSLNQNTVLSHLRRFRILVTKALLELAEEQGLEFHP